MALIEKEIGELRQLIKDFDEKKATKEQVALKIGIYSQTEKRMRLAIQVISLVAKYKKDRLDDFMDAGFPQLLGNNVKNQIKDERCMHDLLKGTCSVCKNKE